MCGLAGCYSTFLHSVDGNRSRNGRDVGDWYVATNGTGQGTSWADATNSLQGAITACSSGYAVFVSNGTYIGSFTIGAGVTVKGKTSLPADVILNGNGVGRVATINASGWLIGCTVSNGYVTSFAKGGGISGGSVSNCIIKNNISLGEEMMEGPCGGGGASDTTLYNCLIINNQTDRGMGGGVRNSTLYNCTLSGNSSSYDAGGVTESVLINCISWENSPPNDSYGAEYTNSYCCGVGEFYLNGIGSITNNPLFVSSTDFSLQPSSPCINIGTNGAWAGLTNATDLNDNKRIWPQGGTVDIGAYEYGSQKDYPGPPSKVANPIPTNNATKQSSATIVSWQDGGSDATGYIINFGLSGNMINCGSTASTNYSPGTLLYSSNYQWRIDATNLQGTTTGDVWNFTVRDVTVVTETDKIIVSNYFKVYDNSVLNNTEISGTFKKILKTGNTTTVAEKIYQWETNIWVATINTNETQCNKMIGIALGANSTANGILTMGDLTVTNTDLTPGNGIYIGSTAGEWTQIMPTNSGYIIRVIGYATETNKIYIEPDNVYSIAP